MVRHDRKIVAVNQTCHFVSRFETVLWAVKLAEQGIALVLQGILQAYHGGDRHPFWFASFPDVKQQLISFLL